MAQNRVNLISISENNEFLLNYFVLESLFVDINNPIAILTIINESECSDWDLNEYIIRYLVNNGKQDWINETKYKWKSDRSDEHFSCVNVWSKPFLFSRHEQHNNKSEKISVILIEVIINECLSEENVHKLIAFYSAISSHVVYVCSNLLQDTIFIKLGESLKNFNNQNSKNRSLTFLVKDWTNSLEVKYRNGKDGNFKHKS